MFDVYEVRAPYILRDKFLAYSTIDRLGGRVTHDTGAMFYIGTFAGRNKAAAIEAAITGKG